MDTFPAHYTGKQNFKGTHLKFKIRSGTFGLESDLLRWNQSDGLCKKCAPSTDETVDHFVLKCDYYHQYRSIMFSNIRTELYKLGFPHVWEYILNASDSSLIKLLVGDHGYLINEQVGNIIDSHFKTFLCSVNYM